MQQGDAFNQKYEERVLEYTSTLGRGSQQPIMATPIQIPPILGFHGPNPDNNGAVQWRWSDPESGTFVTEGPDDDIRGLKFITTGKTVQVVTVVDGIRKTHEPEKMLAELQNNQPRSAGNWFDYYVYELTP